MNFALVTAASTCALFVGMLLLSELGWRLGVARFKRHPDATKEGSAAEAAVFGLLGLLIAFTFSGAAARFHDRLNLIGNEANAIGTAYLRVDLLPADAQPEVRDLFRRYADLRATVYQAAGDDRETRARLGAAEALQRDIWSKVLAASRRPEAPPQAPMLVVPALNEMIDITTTRAVATQTHPPVAIFLLLGVLCLVGALLVGHATSPAERHWFYPVMFAAILSSTVFVIVDIEYPRLGLIRVDSADQILIDLRTSMQ